MMGARFDHFRLKSASAQSVHSPAANSSASRADAARWAGLVAGAERGALRGLNETAAGEREREEAAQVVRLVSRCARGAGARAG